MVVIDKRNANASKSLYEDYFEILRMTEINDFDISSLKEIIRVMLLHFEELDLSFDFEKKVIIYKKASPPMFCPKTLNEGQTFDILYLTCLYNLWNQTIFQLAHEISHCFIYCHNKDDRCSASWIEETICEAMALYFLNYFVDNWDKVSFSKMLPNYVEYISSYLANELSKKGNGRLNKCKDIKELMYIDSVSQSERECRKDEMIDLYKLIKPMDIKGLFCYRDYIIKTTCLLDTKKYRMEFPENVLVKYICDLQDKVLVGESSV